MNRTEKINMLIGLALFVGGTVGMALCLRAADRITKNQNLRKDEMMQELWNDISSMDFYKNADSHEQTLYYNIFWKTTKK